MPAVPCDEPRSAELLDAAFWQAHKDRILAGHVHDVFPYEPAKRFALQRQAAALAAAQGSSPPAATPRPVA